MNYRAFNAKLVTSGSAGLIDRAWGILPVSGVVGTFELEGFVSGSSNHPSMSLQHLVPGQPFGCYVRSITVTNGGSVYVLS